MSDKEVPGPESGGKRFDALERLRGKLDGTKAAETGSPEAEDGRSKVIRLPRRPRRVTEETSEQPRKTWHSEGDSVYDPAPTRPVLRSELQRETGWWPVDPGATRHPAAQPGGAEQDGSVVDLDALRRKRAADAPVAGIRRRAKPRRISDPDSPQPDGPQ
ncbi:hypothetical protein [Nocardia sp. XZ_19_385]|uniref:hypothetical protein n=1 Tax=Nocardia sp. XZ_19_385 TaxID=2769488 RepID=UPI00188E30E8|nr:hypothetical protein [Nocardia sp. XZ_19_385]